MIRNHRAASLVLVASLFAVPAFAAHDDTPHGQGHGHGATPAVPATPAERATPATPGSADGPATRATPATPAHPAQRATPNPKQEPKEKKAAKSACAHAAKEQGLKRGERKDFMKACVNAGGPEQMQ